MKRFAMIAATCFVMTVWGLPDFAQERPDPCGRGALEDSNSIPVPELGSHLRAASDFGRVFELVHASPKGEYEAREAYCSRLKGLSGGRYIFKLVPVEVKYDADSTSLEATFQPDLVALGGIIEIIDRNRASLIVSTRDKPQGSYIGVTGLGVKVKVNRDTEFQDALVFSSKEVMPFQKLEIPLPPSEAKALRGTMRFYVQCRLAPGVVGPARRVSARAAPEYPSANDRKFQYRYLYVDEITLIATTKDGVVRAAKTVVQAPNVRERWDTAFEYPEIEGKRPSQ